MAERDARYGRRLAEIRKLARVSQRELGAAIGVTQSLILAYEKGKSRIPLQRLDAMARALHCAPRHFLEKEGAPLPRLRFQGADNSEGIPPARRAVMFYSPREAD